jgi:hypothetical protein
MHLSILASPATCLHLLPSLRTYSVSLLSLVEVSYLDRSGSKFDDLKSRLMVSDDWKLIFSECGKESPLRKLAVNFCVIATQSDFLRTQLRSMPMEMALDCVGKFAGLRHEMLVDLTHDGVPDTTTSLADLDRCKNYHQHSQNCPSCLGRFDAESKVETLSSSVNSLAGSGRSSSLSSFHSAQQQI